MKKIRSFSLFLALFLLFSFTSCINESGEITTEYISTINTEVITQGQTPETEESAVGTDETTATGIDTDLIVVITVKPETTAEPEATTAPETTAEPEVTTEVEITTEAEVTTVPETTEEPVVTTKPEVTTLPEPETTPEPEVTTEPETTAEPEVTTEVELTTEAEVTTEVEITTEIEVTTVPETTEEPIVTTEPEVTTESEVTTEPETTVEPEVTTEVEATTEAEITTEPETTEEPALTTLPEPETTPEPEITTESEPEEEYNPAPDFTVYDKNGNPVKLSNMLGKPVVLNFWASWCPPCKAEMPDFEEAYREFGDDVVFMMVNLTDGQYETMASAQSFIASMGYTFPVYFDLASDAAYTYGIESIPTTFFISARGNLVAYARGALDAESLNYGISLIYKEK